MDRLYLVDSRLLDVIPQTAPCAYRNLSLGLATDDPNQLRSGHLAVQRLWASWWGDSTEHVEMAVSWGSQYGYEALQGADSSGAISLKNPRSAKAVFQEKLDERTGSYQNGDRIYKSVNSRRESRSIES
jgi:hypothetical protein